MVLPGCSEYSPESLLEVFVISTWTAIPINQHSDRTVQFVLIAEKTKTYIYCLSL